MNPSKHPPLFRLYQLEEDFSKLSDALRTSKVELEEYKHENYSLKHRLKGDSDLYEKVVLSSLRICCCPRK